MEQGPELAYFGDFQCLRARLVEQVCDFLMRDNQKLLGSLTVLDFLLLVELCQR